MKTVFFCLARLLGEGLFRRKGKWILTHDYDNNREAMKPLGRVVRCSRCSFPQNRVATNYCPFCGADMRNKTIRERYLLIKKAREISEEMK